MRARGRAAGRGVGSTSPGGRGRAETGSAMIIAILVIVIMMLLGLAFMLAGETESKIARNQRDAAQAGFLAEGAVRMVKRWFDAPTPTGPLTHLLPTVTQVDRSRRYVDPEADGTYASYTTYAGGPYSAWSVQYRQGSDDLFEKPYRGSPALMLAGIEEHPDIRISETGSSAEQAFLVGLNAGLYPDFPMSNQRGRIRQIDIYGPPIVLVGSQRVRYGIATVKVTADVYQYAGSADETRVATRIVKAVLNEAPYTNPGGVLQSCKDIAATGDFGAHWGNVTAVNVMDLNPNMNVKLDSSVPFYSRDRIITRDMNLDGTLQVAVGGVPTPDDTDGNGDLDFDQWIASTNVEDPWLKFLSEGDVLTNGKAISPGCSGADCQPTPWFRPGPPSAMPYTLTLPAGDDHSNIFKNVSFGLCPQFPYQFWKEVALSGSENVYYYQSDGAGTGTYKLFGQGTSLTFEQAVDGKNGIFFFDTATNTEPVDADFNGTYDNLADEVSLSGQGIYVGGFIYLNADLATTGSGNIAIRKTLIPPGEPYHDANGNKRYDSDEWFVDLDYPGNPGGSYRQNGMYRNSDGGVQRQDPSRDGSVAWTNQQINVLGVFYTSGTFDAQGNWVFFGDVITKSGMTAGAGTPQFYFDERLIKDEWPPVELGLPRTVITSWQTEM